eukprot:8304888-Lingulodinium_polyedra.AAC.1
MAVPDIWHKCMPGFYAFKPGKWELLPELEWDVLYASAAGEEALINKAAKLTVGDELHEV